MDLTSLKPEKRKKYLLLTLPVIIAGIIYLVWNYFLAKPAPIVLEPVPPLEIKINFEILENPDLDKLQLYEEISPFEGEIGRENPFIPYYEIKPAE